MICYSCHSLGKTSPAVADGLCVECGARKWAAELWRDNASRASDLGSKTRYYEQHKTPLIGFTESAMRLFEARFAALLHIDTLAKTTVELDRLAAAKAAFDSRPCGCGILHCNVER